MIFAGLTFVVVLAIIGVVYWALVVRVEAATQRTIDKRIRPEEAASLINRLTPIRHFGLAKSGAELEARPAALIDTVHLPRDPQNRRPHVYRER